MKTKFKYRVAITTGDQDGIGPEVTFKALKEISKYKDIQFFIYTSKVVSKFERLLVRSASEDLLNLHSKMQINIVRSDSSPSNWVEDAAQQAKNGAIDGLVTAPLSKPQIFKDGYSDMGHTGILKRVLKSKSVFMTFLGPKMNVLLLTGHIPIKDVEENISLLELKKAINSVTKLKKSLSIKGKTALVGLNPHAGDSGIIGKFDDRLRKYLSKNIHADLLQDLLVPDAAFSEKNREKIGFYIALYHDQGLIPFKTLHGVESGVHLSLGLPIVRTSVDHGTAKDIFNKNVANSSSMKDAIHLAVELIKNRRV